MSSNQPSSLPILQSERSDHQNHHHHRPDRNDGFWNYGQYHPNDGSGDERRHQECSPSPLTGRKRIQPSVSKTNSQYGNTSPIGEFLNNNLPHFPVKTCKRDGFCVKGF